MSTLLDQRGERTVLVVAHRLSTVQQTDQILYIDSGRLLAHGIHRDLLGDSVAYRRLIQDNALGTGHQLDFFTRSEAIKGHCQLEVVWTFC